MRGSLREGGPILPSMWSGRATRQCREWGPRASNGRRLNRRGPITSPVGVDRRCGRASRGRGDRCCRVRAHGHVRIPGAACARAARSSDWVFLTGTRAANDHEQHFGGAAPRIRPGAGGPHLRGVGARRLLSLRARPSFSGCARDLETHRRSATSSGVPGARRRGVIVCAGKADGRVVAAC